MSLPTSLSVTGAQAKGDRISEGLENKISRESKAKIREILHEVESLSDVEKLLLYLRLPTGLPPVSKDPGPTVKPEQSTAVTWIKSHLEADPDFCIPKHDIYNEYKNYCEKHDLKVLPQSDFSRALRTHFPDVKSRRLGQRGVSKQCYGGLRKQLPMQPLSLPTVDLPFNRLEEPNEETPHDNRVMAAAWSLVFEWAQKLLSKDFTDVHELAEYLVSNHYVNSRSTAAFTVLAAAQKLPYIRSSYLPASAGPASVIDCTSRQPSANREVSAGGSASQQMVSSGCVGQQLKPRGSKDSQVSLGGSASSEVARQLQKKIREKEVKRRLERQRSLNTGEEGDQDTSAVQKAPSQMRCETKERKKSLSIPIKPVTPQKLILPKSPGASQASVSVCSQGAPPPQQSSSIAQSILLLSPPSSSTGVPQPLLILSPMQAKHSMPAQPVAPVVVSQSGQAPSEQIQPVVINQHEFTGKSQEPSSQIIVNSTMTANDSDSSFGATTVSVTTSQNFTTVTVPAEDSLQLTTAAAVDTASSPASVMAEGVAARTINCTAATAADVKPEIVGSQATIAVAAGSPAIMLPATMASQNQAQVSTKSKSGSNTPVKRKYAGKRVSELLKERRGYGPQDDVVPYVNDRRPVCHILKERRMRAQMSPAAGSSQCDASGQQQQEQELFSAGTMPMNSHSHILQALAARSANAQLSCENQLKTASYSCAGSPAMTDSTCGPLPSTTMGNLSVPGGSTNTTLQDQQAIHRLLLQRAQSEPALCMQQPTNSVIVQPEENDKTQLALLLCQLQNGSKTALESAAGVSTLLAETSLGQDVNISNLEKDAMQEFFEQDSESDLADIQPSICGMVGTPGDQTGTYNVQKRQLADLPAAAAASQLDFFSPPKVQRNIENMAENCMLSGESHSLQYEGGATGMSGMAAPLHGGSRSVGQSPLSFYQGSVCSSPMPSPASSTQRSSNSTPMSMLPSQFNQHPYQQSGSNADSANVNAFTPIQQTSIDAMSMVNPVKPMATVASMLPLINMAAGMQTPCVTVGSGAQNSQTWTVPSTPSPAPTLRQKLRQEFPLPPAVHSSALAALLAGKPAKRARAQNMQQGGNSKRMRHHSAQSSFNSLRNSSRIGQPQQLTRHQQLQQEQQQQQQPQPQAPALTAPPTPQEVGVLQQSLMSLSQDPESPFSPEISDIMGSSNASWETAINALRSHSVPVQNMFAAYTDSSQDRELFNNTMTGNAGYQDLNSDDLGQLLQDKLQGTQHLAVTRSVQHLGGHQYNAKRNLTEILETGREYGGSCRGDHMISGASVRPTQGKVSLTDDVNMNCESYLPKLQQRHRQQHQLQQQQQTVTTSYPGHSVPTPPSSHNASPSLCSEMADMIGLNPSGMVAPHLDTPNSLDTDQGTTGGASPPSHVRDPSWPTSYGRHQPTDDLLGLICVTDGYDG